MSAKQQTEVIANYIMANVPGEPSRDEGAGDCAVRLLGEYQAAIEDYQQQVECADEDYQEQLERAAQLSSKYRTALTGIMRELGVPDANYPAPIANAYEIARQALGEEKIWSTNG